MIIKDQIDRAIAISREIKNGRDAGVITQNTLPDTVKNSISDFKSLYDNYIQLNFKDYSIKNQNHRFFFKRIKMKQSIWHEKFQLKCWL